MRNRILIILVLILPLFANAEDKGDYKYVKDISYVDESESDDYKKERCKLDVYYPEDKADFPTIVWFHGGGLENGGKWVPEEFKNKGIAVVSVNYRLSPKATNPAYTEDAAQAVAWVFENIQEYGGSAEDIYISGHSAGGYLTLMVGLDKSYLNKYGVDADRIKGLIPISGQTNTHYTIRKERGLPMDIPIVDTFSPLNKSRKGIPPTLLITGDRNLEMTARFEENIHLYSILKAQGNIDVELFELQGFNHGTVCSPACFLAVEWIKKYSK